MIYTYGFSIAGSSHAQTGTPCQDYHMVESWPNGWSLAVIADGVGSAAQAHVGSKTAAEAVAEFCRQYMPRDANLVSIKSMLRTAYNHALNCVYNAAEEAGLPVEAYDTTLTTVLYDGSRIVYAHSGDGGIFGLVPYGDYVAITTPQKGEDSISVIPLRAGYTNWVIDSYCDDLAAVLLVTDGLWEMLTPYLLRREDKTLYIPACMFLMDSACFPYGEDTRAETDGCIRRYLAASLEEEAFYKVLARALHSRFSPEEAQEALGSYHEIDYALKAVASVQDDKTAVALINTALSTEAKPLAYYMEPNWQLLHLEWEKLAYPHLHTDIDASALSPTATEEAAAAPAADEETDTPVPASPSADDPVDDEPPTTKLPELDESL